MDSPARPTYLSAPDLAPIALDDAGAERFADLLAFPRAGEAPWVRTVFNQTLDGAIAGPDGSSLSLATAEDRFVFAALRALADVVLVGAGTVRAEDYSRVAGRASLRTRRVPHGQDPVPALAVLTRTGDVPVPPERRHRMLLLAPPDRLAAVRAETALPQKNVLPAGSVSEAVAALARHGLRRVQLEGGPGVLAAALGEGAVDELCLTTTFTTVGGDAPRMAAGAWHRQVWRQHLLLTGPGALFGAWRRA